jgi:hypothetical protein
MIAEQQLAKSEIEASLTIAAARPRDEKVCFDSLIISCQRPGLASESQYNYSRGGTDISGPSIKLMEVIAQKWGNLDFGFRELARFPGEGGRAGESIVEAYAWDLESNTRRRVQFTVQHVREKKSGNTPLTDPRDIYEMVANMAQRRVRTCLENIIPRDIQDAACEECDRTLRAKITDVAKMSREMVEAFARVGVSQSQIEARIQRRLDAITPAQIIGLQKIFNGIRDGISHASDWFPSEEPAGEKKSAIEQAKDALRKTNGAAKKEAPQAGNAEPKKPDEPVKEQWTGDADKSSGFVANTGTQVDQAAEQHAKEHGGELPNEPSPLELAKGMFPTLDTVAEVDKYVDWLWETHPSLTQAEKTAIGKEASKRRLQIPRT